MEKPKKATRAKVSISLEDSVLKETILLAQKEDRGLSNYINLVLKKNIQNQKES